MMKTNTKLLLISIPTLVSIIFMYFWLNYQFLTIDKVPMGDELNFFIPWLLTVFRNNNIYNFIQPQGPHFHISYKIYTIFSYYFLEFNQIFSNIIAPFTYLISFIILLMHSIGKFNTSNNVKATMTGHPFNASYATLAAVALALACLSPIRTPEAQYDMLAINGTVNIALLIFLLTISKNFIFGNKFKFSIYCGILIIFFVLFSNTVNILFIVCIPISLLLLTVINKNFEKYNNSNKYIRITILSLLIIFLVSSYMYTLTFYNFGGSEKFELNIKSILFSVDDGVSQSLGGKAFLDNVVGLKNTLITTQQVSILIFILSIPLIIYAVKTGKFVSLTLIIIAASIPIAAYALRGSAAAPRYQGFLTIFWIGIALLHFQMTLERLSNLSQGDFISRTALIAGYLLMLFYVPIAIYYGTYRYKYYGSVVKYNKAAIEFFYSDNPVTMETQKLLHCRKTVAQCSESIEFIRSIQGISGTENMGQ